MADVSVHTQVFTRGSTVLEYWLAHAEGLTVQPLGARVEQVIVAPPLGHAQALLVRSRSGRLRTIPAEAIAAVEPSAGCLLLDRPRRGRAAARTAAAGTGTAAQAAVAAAVWLRPRTVRALRTFGTDVAVGSLQLARWTKAGLAWLAPRVVAGSRRAAAATRRTAVAGAALASVAAERGRASLAEQRAQRARGRL